MILFIMLDKVVLAFKPVDEIVNCDYSNESCYKQDFPVVLFIMLSIQTFKYVNEILKWSH